MKKIIPILLCVVLMFSFFACSKSKNEPEFTENSSSTTVNADDVENTNEYSENSVRIVRNINSAVDEMDIKSKDKLSDKDVKSFEKQINGTCIKKDSKNNTYRFIVGSTVEFSVDMKNKQITFYVNDELYAQRTIK